MPPSPKSGCPSCVTLGLGLCALLIELNLDRPNSIGPIISQTQFDFAARRTIFRQNDTLDHVPVICDGWAAATMKLSNGRRQILSFLLPGELITSRLVFEPKLHVSIDAITEGSYRTFNRSQLRTVMSNSPVTFDRILAAYNAESGRGDQMIATLGQRTAYERVACLLVDLWERLEKSSRIDANRVKFPLRQTHIADATGLTPVYVGKVLSDFRKDSLVDISDRILQIDDMTRLRRLVT